MYVTSRRVCMDSCTARHATFFVCSCCAYHKIAESRGRVKSKEKTHTNMKDKRPCFAGTVTKSSNRCQRIGLVKRGLVLYLVFHRDVYWLRDKTRHSRPKLTLFRHLFSDHILSQLIGSTSDLVTRYHSRPHLLISLRWL